MDRITIRCAKKHTIAYPLFFEVGVQVELSHRQLAWSMAMLPGSNLATEGLHILAVRMTDAQYIRREGKSPLF